LIQVLGHGVWDYLKENADYPYYMIRDRCAGAAAKSLRSVRRGHGKVIEHHGTWDCPCHGSRFTTNGDVLVADTNAPARPEEAGRRALSSCRAG